MSVVVRQAEIDPSQGTGAANADDSPAGHSTKSVLPSLRCDAPEPIRCAIATLGRAEDVSFSPNGKRIAITGFAHHRISVFDLALMASVDGPRVYLRGGAHITSAALNNPHGLDFVDDEHVSVANRSGTVTV